jgi:hypothetical protein
MAARGVERAGGATRVLVDEGSRAHAIALLVVPLERDFIDRPVPLSGTEPTATTGRSFAAGPM